MIKKAVFFLFTLLVISSCKKEVSKSDFTQITKVKSVTYNNLKPLLEKNDNKIYVVNFWATWCAPCVKELPHFEKLGKEYAVKNVEILLVSLDFPKQVEKRLLPFINKKELKSEVVLLDDTNEDFWIKAIAKDWSGAIPATLIYNKNKRKFYEQSFEYDALETELKTFLTN